MNRTQADVIVVGAGPAGLAAAIALRRQGAGRVLVLDREREPGGVPRHCHHTGFGVRDLYRFLSGPAYAARYARLAERHGVDIRTETSVTGWGEGTTLVVTSPAGRDELAARAIVLATGCRERPRAARMIPGTRPQGVFTSGSLQQFVHLHHQRVGRRAVVVGADHVGFSAILTLKEVGTDVACIVTDLPRHQSFFQYKLISADRYRVPLLTQTRVTRIAGRGRVEAVELTNVRDGSAREVACDTVVFSGDWIPDYELAFLGGLEIDPRLKGPRVTQRLQTTRPGVFAAGNLLHAAETADVAALSGRAAAASVAEYLDGGAWAPATVPLLAEDPIAWVSPGAVAPDAASAPRGQLILRVAEVLAGRVLEAWQADRRLWHKRMGRMIPNLPVYVPAGWLGQVDPAGGPVRLRVI